MASNAKQIVAYEETDHGLQPMDEERYLAFLQEGTARQLAVRGAVRRGSDPQH